MSYFRYIRKIIANHGLSFYYFPPHTLLTRYSGLVTQDEDPPRFSIHPYLYICICNTKRLVLDACLSLRCLSVIPRVSLFIARRRRRREWPTCTVSLPDRDALRLGWVTRSAQLKKKKKKGVPPYLASFLAPPPEILSYTREPRQPVAGWPIDPEGLNIDWSLLLLCACFHWAH